MDVNQLNTVLLPQVNARVTELLPKGWAITKAEPVQFADNDTLLGYNFNYTFALNGKTEVDAYEMSELATALNYFTGTDDGDADYPVVDRMRFCIGDGDDSTAVMFVGHLTARIWVRWFKDEEFFQVDDAEAEFIAFEAQGD